MCVCAHASGCAGGCAGGLEALVRGVCCGLEALDLLEQKLLMDRGMDCQPRLLGTELGSSEGQHMLIIVQPFLQPLVSCF